MINNFLLAVLAAGAILSGILVITSKNSLTAAAILLCAAALSFNVEYGIFSGLGIISLVPIKYFMF